MDRTTEAQGIFVNLPVRELERSKAFFAALGFGFDARFTDAKAACLVLGERMFAMLLSEPFFAGFTPKPVADARRATEVLVALQVDSRERVDELVAAALAAGGRAPMPKVDHGFMLQHGFEDLDGHQWEVFHMDPSKLPAADGAG